MCLRKSPHSLSSNASSIKFNILYKIFDKSHCLYTYNLVNPSSEKKAKIRTKIYYGMFCCVTEAMHKHYFWDHIFLGLVESIRPFTYTI